MKPAQSFEKQNEFVKDDTWNVAVERNEIHGGPNVQRRLQPLLSLEGRNLPSDTYIKGLLKFTNSNIS